MGFNQNQIATYLFCAELSNSETVALTTIEWNLLVHSLDRARLEPKHLYEMSSSELTKLLVKGQQRQITNICKKVEARQRLGMALGEMESTINQGIQIIFRKDMPQKLKKLPTKLLPAFFYVAGNLSIFNAFTIGVVGARTATEKELTITKKIGEDAAREEIAIVSGGAKGVDHTSVESCLNAGGNAIIFCADGLAKHIRNKKNREWISQNKLVLLTAQAPTANFKPGYAMTRNKFIHASGDYVVITSSQISGSKRSGTWEGVMENFKASWTPMFAIGESIGVQKMLNDSIAQEFRGIDNTQIESILINKSNDNLEVEISKIVEVAYNKKISKESLIHLINKSVDLVYEEEKDQTEQLRLLN